MTEVLGGTERTSPVKARYAYPLLFLAPIAMLGIIVAALAVAAGAGVLWIFVYGDHPWPASANTALMAPAVLIGLGVIVGLTVAAYRVGKARESRGGLPRGHMLAALGLSIGLPLLVLLHQWQVGNLGRAQVPPGTSPESTPLRGAA